MRYLLLLPLLTLLACKPDPQADTAAAAANTQLTTAQGKPEPADYKMTGDAATDAVIREYVRLDEQYHAGMLQRKDVTYQCGKILGRVELYTEDGKFAMAVNHYNDGDQRTVTDRWYLKDEAPVHFKSESITWEIQGPMVKQANGMETPGIRTATNEYRYYIADGKVFKFLKKSYEHFNYRSDNVDPATVANVPANTNGDIPARFAIVEAARETGSVACELWN